MNSVGCIRNDCDFRLCEQCFDEIVDYEFKETTGPARYLYNNKPHTSYLIKPWVDSDDN